MATSASPSSETATPVNPQVSDPSLGASSTPSITIQNIGSMVPIKLTTTNYLTWSALFAPIFRRYNLTGILDGSVPPPSQFISDAAGHSVLNPAYVSWFENDQNILIWINSTLSESIIPYTVGVTNSRELWAKLESRLAAASQSHIHELRSRLRCISKGDSTAAQYLQQIEAIADALASVGAPVEDSELISVTLHGLPPDYDSFVDAIQFRLGSTTIDELHGLLLSKEIQLANRKKTSPPVQIQAYNSTAGILPTPTSQAFVAQGRGSDHNFSQGRHFSSSKYGQSRGNFRSNNFRPNYSRNNSQRYTRGGRSNFTSSGRKNPCQISQSSQPTWLIDSSASTHMTNSYTNLQNPASYSGPEQVYIGDGKVTHGIHHQLSCPHTPQQNGCAERKHRHIVETARTLLTVSQAPRAWYEKLHAALRTLGFVGSQSDHSLFVKKDPLVFVLVYVDDIIVTGPSTSACQQVISQLSSLFPIKDLGALHYFLGIEVHRSSTGALQYLTWTRPDLSFAVNLVCQFMHSPRQSHLLAVKRILRYLKGTIELGLWFTKSPSVPSLTAFSDTDWLWCDNQSAISLAKNPLFHARTKHVELDYHYIREKQQWRAAESEMGAAQTAKTRSVDVMLMVVADAQESYAII
ncbi:hypothetical protein D8674_006982 [Pyrus ussuriensis x Pyrus communis]|uniref:Reverse transcriptase Ty1/copia-type domain-containing protein n=1 Tax=Pyrus ussuriensis x Pyrus communis TaxID=2448454 RepID=A0A5N5FVV0_9ROSA|nr:hypothetical protein D8674_006982 [Pyrus ussuriensis x Pyrus communis]